ncbi:MAG: hypothetical protein WAN12_19665 [Candidatus Acidiferrum sp.]
MAPKKHEKICSALDWLIGVLGRALILVMLGLTFYFSYLLVRGKLDTTDKEILHGLTLNWKAVLLVMIPLFYVPVRIFLEEAYEILGVKRQPQSAVSAETAPAPPTTDMEGK